MKVNTKTNERILHINRGIENRLASYMDKIEVERRRFLRNMIHAQVFVRSEYKKLRDEKLRCISEKNLIRHRVKETNGDGLLHCPGIQDRMTRQKFKKKATINNSSVLNDGDLADTRQRPWKSYQSFHPIPSPPLIISANEIRSQKRMQLEATAISCNQMLMINQRKNFMLSAPPHFKQNRSLSRLSRTHATLHTASQKHFQSASANSSADDTINRSASQNQRDSFGKRKVKRNQSFQMERSRTAPSLSRLSVARKQTMEEEADYVLHLRKQSQQLENENITKKVWSFIGKRPVSAFSSYSINYSLVDGDKRRKESESVINDDENKELLQRIQGLSRTPR